MHALKIDAFEFCRQKEQREGDVSLAELQRLSAELTDKSGILHWHLSGGANAYGHPVLTLGVTGDAHVRCQRCMQPFAVQINTNSELVLGKSEDDADEIEGVLDDDSVDVIVGTRSMLVLDLVEDEALLALPLAPKHEKCPESNELEHLTSSGKVSPFAILKNKQ